MRTFGEKEILELDKDITGIHIEFVGSCPGTYAPEAGDYFKVAQIRAASPDIPFTRIVPVTRGLFTPKKNRRLRYPERLTINPEQGPFGQH